MLMRYELLKRFAESIAFKISNTFVHYINSINEEYHVIIKQIKGSQALRLTALFIIKVIIYCQSVNFKLLILAKCFVL